MKYGEMAKFFIVQIIVSYSNILRNARRSLKNHYTCIQIPHQTFAECHPFDEKLSCQGKMRQKMGYTYVNGRLEFLQLVINNFEDLRSRKKIKVRLGAIIL